MINGKTFVRLNKTLFNSDDLFWGQYQIFEPSKVLTSNAKRKLLEIMSSLTDYETNKNSFNEKYVHSLEMVKQVISQDYGHIKNANLNNVESLFSPLETNDKLVYAVVNDTKLIFNPKFLKTIPKNTFVNFYMSKDGLILKAVTPLYNLYILGCRA